MPAEQDQQATHDEHRPADRHAERGGRNVLRLRVSRDALDVREVAHATLHEEGGEADATDPGDNGPEIHGGAPVGGWVNGRMNDRCESGERRADLTPCPALVASPPVPLSA